MSALVTATYDLVRYSPSIRPGKPFQIVGTDSDHQVVEIAADYEQAADLVKSLSMLLLSVSEDG